MDDGLTLIGFRYSVYTRIARMALIEMGLDAKYVEANPFTPSRDPVLSEHTPFNRVPVLRRNGFTLTETGAITRYLDHLHASPSFVPTDARALARMMQIIGIVDAYGYQPLVRQVFSHGFYRPHFEEIANAEQVAEGLEAAQPVLRLLDQIAAQGEQLSGTGVSLADIHLAPMIAYFTKVEEARRLLTQYQALSTWWDTLSKRTSLRATDPFPET